MSKLQILFLLLGNKKQNLICAFWPLKAVPATMKCLSFSLFLQCMWGCLVNFFSLATNRSQTKAPVTRQAEDCFFSLQKWKTTHVCQTSLLRRDSTILLVKYLPFFCPVSFKLPIPNKKTCPYISLQMSH